MVCNLEAQKIMNGFHRVGIFGVDPDLRALLCILGGIGNLILEPFHRVYSWRDRVMNKHRERKIAFRKHGRNLRHMFSNRVPAVGVARIIGLDFDCAAIGEHAKMMTGQLVAEAHGLIAAVIDHLAMIIFWFPGRSRWFLPSDQEGCRKNKQERKSQKDSPNISCVIEQLHRRTMI
jgi:hypothetical protein